MDVTVKKTGLHAWHLASGASMAAFGGYHMPLWYSSAKNEHLSVLTAAGLFDTSHMAALRLRGRGAHDLLQAAFTQNLDACIGAGRAPLAVGRCVYGAFLNDDGHVVDDSIVYQLAAESYMAVVNAGMGPVVARHLEEQRDGREVHIQDLSDRLGKIDIQGPQSARILGRLIRDPDRAFDRLPYFAFRGHFDPAADGADAVVLRNGAAVLLSRTGYTGEFGFEIFLDPSATVDTWELLLEVGRGAQLTPCGLAARDSLRAGAVLPLSHQDIGPWPFVRHPWRFALPWSREGDAFTKTFRGAAALLAQTSADYTYAFVGQDPRKVSTSEPTVVLDGQGRAIGRVLTCVTDMGIGRVDGRVLSVASPDAPEGFVPKGLCCGFVKVAHPLPKDDRIQIQDSRRTIEVRIVSDIRPDRTARKPIASMR
ncbi:MAG: aminomethyl transferase family protein [Desulfobacterales bacterium]|nr:aminomethyl transferase family protein [Desulfobacterales bacterium]